MKIKAVTRGWGCKWEMAKCASEAKDAPNMPGALQCPGPCADQECPCPCQGWPSSLHSSAICQRAQPSVIFCGAQPSSQGSLSLLPSPWPRTHSLSSVRSTKNFLVEFSRTMPLSYITLYSPLDLPFLCRNRVSDFWAIHLESFPSFF